MYRIFIILIISSITYTFIGCSSIPSCCVIAPPKIHMTGGKTVIERQIVGDFKELEDNSWIISSVKTTGQNSEGAALDRTGDIELFKAMKIRNFHKYKIRSYKDQKVIGEGNNGLIKYMKIKKYEKDKHSRNILLKLIKNENQARKIIFTRSLIKIKGKVPEKKDMEAFGKIFAEEQIALSKKNDWVQNVNGRWVKK
jgi:uncharacterized protein YdbL (DUF1318 family)